MADSKCLDQAEPVQYLIHCVICHAVVDKPKMLPCLHSFCLHCLSSWAESAAEKDSDPDSEKYKNKISCPSCEEEYDLPTGGVKFLETNFFMLKLNEMKTIQQKLDSNDVIPCTSPACEATSNPAVSHCVECHDFLCKTCVDAHKRVRVGIDHQLLSLEEFCADNQNRPMFNHPEQEKCVKHKGEALLFFCEECKVPICRNCTEVDHLDHMHLNLEKAVGRCTEELNKLVTACPYVSDTLDLPIETDKKTLADFKSAVVKVEDEILKASDRIKTAYLQKLHTVEAKREKVIGGHLKTLQSLQSRLRLALEVTPIVTQIGSDHDKATMFCALASTIKQACEIEPKAIRQSLAKVGFTPNEELVENLSRFGSLVIDKFVLDKTFGQELLQNARCAVFDMAGDIVVTDHGKNTPIKVFDHGNKQLKRNVNIAGVGGGDNAGYSQPWGLVIGKDGQCFVTDLNPYVKVFDAQGNFKRRFGTIVGSGGQWSYYGYKLYGLAIDCNGRVLVGSVNSCISIHGQDQPDGSYTSYFTVKIVPHFIAVTSADHILVSDHASHRAVHAYDNEGKHLHTFQKPQGVATWYPTGICCVHRPCSDEDVEEEVYVACKSPAAIYRYSVTGKYLGVFTEDVKEPWGISVKIDDNAWGGGELLVVDQNTIKVFKLE